MLAAAGFAVALLVRLILVRRLPAPVEGDEPHWPTVLHEVVDRTSTLFLLIAAVYAGSLVLELPPQVQNLIASAFTIALFIQLALWADRIASAVLAWRLAPLKTKSAMRNALSLIQFFVRVAVWSLALLLLFENLGFDVTALVAGLGIGGIAIALAAQSVLGDLFSSLAIVLDRPFEVGDFIVFGDQNGTVEKIGIKTTRIRSLSGEQIACSNTDLMNSRIHNFKRMAERRIVLVLGVTYDTPASTLERIPSMVKEIVEGQEPSPIRPLAFSQLRRLGSGVRDRLLGAERRLHRLHGRATGHQLRHSSGLRGGRASSSPSRRARSMSRT